MFILHSFFQTSFTFTSVFLNSHSSTWQESFVAVYKIGHTKHFENHQPPFCRIWSWSSGKKNHSLNMIPVLEKWSFSLAFSAAILPHLRNLFSSKFIFLWTEKCCCGMGHHREGELEPWCESRIFRALWKMKKKIRLAQTCLIQFGADPERIVLFDFWTNVITCAWSFSCISASQKKSFSH